MKSATQLRRQRKELRAMSFGNSPIETMRTAMVVALDYVLDQGLVPTRNLEMLEAVYQDGLKQRRKMMRKNYNTTQGEDRETK